MSINKFATRVRVLLEKFDDANNCNGVLPVHNLEGHSHGEYSVEKLQDGDLILHQDKQLTK